MASSRRTGGRRPPRPGGDVRAAGAGGNPSARQAGDQPSRRGGDHPLGRDGPALRMVGLVADHRGRRGDPSDHSPPRAAPGPRRAVLGRSLGSGDRRGAVAVGHDFHRPGRHGGGDSAGVPWSLGHRRDDGSVPPSPAAPRALRGDRLGRPDGVGIGDRLSAERRARAARPA